MEGLIKPIVEKISSYNLFNNLFPGILFCYLLKTMLGIVVVSNNWIENLVIYYFVGIVISRVGSIVIEPIMKKIKIRKKPLLQFSSYSDYERASKDEPLVAVFSETNNTYRTLLSCFICIFVLKICIVINEICVGANVTFFQDNIEWVILLLLIMLFSFSYVKQTSYVSKRISSVIKRTEAKKSEAQ